MNMFLPIKIGGYTWSILVHTCPPSHPTRTQTHLKRYKQSIIEQVLKMKVFYSSQDLKVKAFYTWPCHKACAVPRFASHLRSSFRQGVMSLQPSSSMPLSTSPVHQLVPLTKWVVNPSPSDQLSQWTWQAVIVG